MLKIGLVKLTFLGTGTSQGIPVIGSTHPVCLSSDPRDKRLRSSVLISWEKNNYVIDCGPDFRQQLLNTLSRKQNNEQCFTLDGILFTHEHADHVAGLDDIRPFVFKQGDIPLYGSKRVLENLAHRFEYIFAKENRYPGAPSVNTQLITDNTPIVLNGFEVQPIKVMHGKLPIYGYRFGKLAYLTDVKTIADSELEKLKGVEVLIINALRTEVHSTHLNLEEALQLIARINPKRSYLTHISHYLGFHAEVEKRLPENIFLAYDNLTITI